MFIAKLIQSYRQDSNHSKTQIKIKPFVDLFLDTAGWYAIGHHDQNKFLAAVIKKEKYPYLNFHPNQVQQGWAKFDDNNFELIEQTHQDAQPITFVEDLGAIPEDDEY